MIFYRSLKCIIKTMYFKYINRSVYTLYVLTYVHTYNHINMYVCISM